MSGSASKCYIVLVNDSQSQLLIVSVSKCQSVLSFSYITFVYIHFVCLCYIYTKKRRSNCDYACVYNCFFFVCRLRITFIELFLLVTLPENFIWAQLCVNMYKYTYMRTYMRMLTSNISSTFEYINYIVNLITNNFSKDSK